MPEVGMKLVRKPRSSYYQHTEIREEVLAELDKLGKRHIASRRRVVAGFRHDIQFAYEVIYSPYHIELSVFVSNSEVLGDGPETVKDLWRWLNEGTPPHRIEATESEYLAFVPGAQSQTGTDPARFGEGAPGVGDMVFVPGLDHPGFEGRHFDLEINADLRDDFDSAVNRGYKRGMRKVTR